MTQTPTDTTLNTMKEMKINQLTKLDEIGLSTEDLLVAMRPIKKFHVTALSEVETKELPPLLIGEYSGNYVLLGGYHRVESRREREERKLRLAKNPNADGQELKQLLTRALTEVETQEIENRYKQTTMAVVVIRYDNTFEMILAAQEDNLKNGLALEENSRTQMAKWYYLKAQDSFEKGEIAKAPSYRKVADKYGIKGQTLWDSVQKHKKAIAQAIEDAKQKDLTEGTEQPKEVKDEKPEKTLVTNYVSKDVKKDVTKLVKAIVTFISTIEGIQFDETLTTQIVRDINVALTEYNVSEQARGDENDSLDIVDLERLGIWFLASTQVESQKMLTVKLKNVLHPQPKASTEKTTKGKQQKKEGENTKEQEVVAE